MTCHLLSWGTLSSLSTWPNRRKRKDSKIEKKKINHYGSKKKCLSQAGAAYKAAGQAEEIRLGMTSQLDSPLYSQHHVNCSLHIFSGFQSNPLERCFSLPDDIQWRQRMKTKEESSVRRWHFSSPVVSIPLTFALCVVEKVVDCSFSTGNITGLNLF